MSVAACLLRAREILAGGWCEPLPLDVDGRCVDARSEDAARFDLLSALELAAESPRERADAYELLESVLRPATHALNTAGASPEMTDATVSAIATVAITEPESIHTWLVGPNRRPEQVLRLFDMALARAKTLEAA